MCFFFFQAEAGIRDLVRSRGLGDVYKRQLRGGAPDESLRLLRAAIRDRSEERRRLAFTALGTLAARRPEAAATGSEGDAAPGRTAASPPRRSCSASGERPKSPDSSGVSGRSTD